MLADWLGSDQTFFPYRPEFAPNYIEDARRRARQAVAAVGLDIAAQRSQVTPPSVYADLFEIDRPTAMQRAVADLPADAPLVILESETGSGKTEAALWHFARLYAAGRVDGLYFALPTRAAASQMHARVTRMVARMFPATSRPETVLALPGYLRAGEATGRPLPDFQVLWDDAPDASTRSRRWAAEHAKRYLAAQIAIGTVDQAMLAAMAVKHAHMRAACLARSLLVIDEVHASDVYMRTILSHLLDGHRAAGGSALLLSATLGGAVRHGLMGGTPRTCPPLADLEAVAYPALWAVPRDGGAALLVHGAPEARCRKRVALTALPLLDQPDDIAQQALAAADLGARVLVIMNTVTGAVAVQRSLEALVQTENAPPDLLFRLNKTATLHHGRFAPADRQRLDQAVEGQFGKHGAHGDAGGRILVGTQTLEQSLDIDADLLITTLCPIDVLLQRLGRLHRHAARPRPAGFEAARCCLIVPEDRDLSRFLTPTAKSEGLGTVYGDVLMLEATWRLLEDSPAWAIPADNRRLVDRGTHPDHLAAIAEELGAIWQQHHQARSGKALAESLFGRNALLRRGRGFLDQDVRFPDAEERIRTRLGEEGPRAEFDPAPMGPFGDSVPTLALPAHLTAGSGESLAPETVRPLPGDEGFTFSWGSLTFRYDRLGLRREETTGHA